MAIGNSTNYLRIIDINNIDIPIAEVLTGGGNTISWIEFIEKDLVLVVCFNNNLIQVKYFIFNYSSRDETFLIQL